MINLYLLFCINSFVWMVIYTTRSLRYLSRDHQDTCHVTCPSHCISSQYDLHASRFHLHFFSSHFYYRRLKRGHSVLHTAVHAHEYIIEDRFPHQPCPVTGLHQYFKMIAKKVHETNFFRPGVNQTETY